MVRAAIIVLLFLRVVLNVPAHPNVNALCRPTLLPFGIIHGAVCSAMNVDKYVDIHRDGLVGILSRLSGSM